MAKQYASCRWQSDRAGHLVNASEAALVMATFTDQCVQFAPRVFLLVFCSIHCSKCRIVELWAWDRQTDRQTDFSTDLDLCQYPHWLIDLCGFCTQTLACFNHGLTFS